MIRAAHDLTAPPAANALRGEFTAAVAGEPHRFDTRLATVAAIEDACGDRPIVEVLNGVVLGRRARDVIPLIAAALAAAEPGRPDAAALARRATVEEGEVFVLGLILALGFTVAPHGEGGATSSPLDGAPDGGAGASSRSAA